MEIDRAKLIALLEAFVDVSEVLQRELMLYQMLFASTCKTQKLSDEQSQQLLKRAREASCEKIKTAAQASHQDLLAKIPRIVDLLGSNQDEEALRFLREWKSKGPPN